MELDFVVAYTVLAVALVVALSVASIPSPGHNLQEFLTQVAVAASHPGTVLRARLVLPPGVAVEASGDTLVVRGAAVPPSAAALYEELGVGEMASGHELRLNFTLSMPRLSGGYVYALRVHSSPGRVAVEVVSARRLPD